MARRVAVTGIGLVTPLGIGTSQTWSGLLEGRTGVGPLTGFDSSSLHTRQGGEVAGFAPGEFIANRRNLRMMTRGDQLSYAGASLAIRDSGVDVAAMDGDRVALFVGGSKEVSDPHHLEEPVLASRRADGSVDVARFGESAQSTAYPLFYLVGLPAASLFFISETFGITGPGAFIAGYDESSASAIGIAYRTLLRGEVDVAVAGGFEDAVSWWPMTKLDGLGVLSDRNELGPRACRPFDRDRTGTLPGEGSAFVVMEELDSARARGARVYAEVTGFGSAFDGYRLLTPEPSGSGLRRAVQAALRESGSAAAQIGYFAASGSGSRLGDASHAQGLRSALGADADSAVGSSVKAATGNLLAAAGALNFSVAALALHHGAVPPTLHLDAVDPDCRLDWVANEARDLAVDRAMALAQGFEGQSVALALRRAEG